MSGYREPSDATKVLLVIGVLCLLATAAYYIEQWRADVWARAMERHHVQDVPVRPR